MGITACMLVRDELPFLKHSVPAARKVADELIAVDMGSKDGSLEYLEERADTIVTITPDSLVELGFGLCRNLALVNATQDWVYWVDADEMLSAEQVDEFRATSEKSDAADFWSMEVFTFNDSNFHFENWNGIANNVGYEWGRHVRMHRRLPDIEWRGHIHEELFRGEERAFDHCWLSNFKHLHYTKYRRWGNREDKEARISYMLLQAYEKRDTLGKYMSPWWFNNWYDHNLPAIRRSAERYERERHRIDPAD